MQVELEFKKNIYQQIVKEAKVEEEMCKQAIAFLVEAMSKLYPLDQSTVLLKGIVEKVKKDPKEALKFLDEQITTAYQATLADPPKGQKDNWHSLNQLYDMLKKSRDDARNRGEHPVLFGGVNKRFIPDWYGK